MRDGRTHLWPSGAMSPHRKYDLCRGLVSHVEQSSPQVKGELRGVAIDDMHRADPRPEQRVNTRHRQSSGRPAARGRAVPDLATAARAAERGEAREPRGGGWRRGARPWHTRSHPPREVAHALRRVARSPLPSLAAARRGPRRPAALVVGYAAVGAAGLLGRSLRDATRTTLAWLLARDRARQEHGRARRT